MRRYLNRLPRFDEREPLREASGSDLERGYMRVRDADQFGYPGADSMPMEAESAHNLNMQHKPNGGRSF